MESLDNFASRDVDLSFLSNIEMSHPSAFDVLFERVARSRSRANLNLTFGRFGPSSSLLSLDTGSDTGSQASNASVFRTNQHHDITSQCYDNDIYNLSMVQAPSVLNTSILSQFTVRPSIVQDKDSIHHKIQTMKCNRQKKLNSTLNALVSRNDITAHGTLAIAEDGVTNVNQCDDSVDSNSDDGVVILNMTKSSILEKELDVTDKTEKDTLVNELVEKQKTPCTELNSRTTSSSYDLKNTFKYGSKREARQTPKMAEFMLGTSKLSKLLKSFNPVVELSDLTIRPLTDSRSIYVEGKKETTHGTLEIAEDGMTNVNQCDDSVDSDSDDGVVILNLTNSSILEKELDVTEKTEKDTLVNELVEKQKTPCNELKSKTTSSSYDQKNTFKYGSKREARQTPKMAAEFMRGTSKLSKLPKSFNPVVKLSDWIIRPLPNSRGICVEGKKEGMLDFWHSTAITEAKTGKLVMTASGSEYWLKGKMNELCTIDTGFTADVAKAFKNGFPKNWKDVIEEFYTRIEESIPIGDELSPVKYLYHKKKGTRIQNHQKKKELQNKSKVTLKEQNKKPVSAKRLKAKPQPKEMENGKDLDSVLTPVGLIKKSLAAASLTYTRSGRVSLPPLARWSGQKYVIKNTEVMVDFETSDARRAVMEETRAAYEVSKSFEKMIKYQSGCLAFKEIPGKGTSKGHKSKSKNTEKGNQNSCHKSPNGKGLPSFIECTKEKLKRGRKTKKNTMTGSDETHKNKGALTVKGKTVKPDPPKRRFSNSRTPNVNTLDNQKDGENCRHSVESKIKKNRVPPKRSCSKSRTPEVITLDNQKNGENCQHSVESKFKKKKVPSKRHSSTRALNVVSDNLKNTKNRRSSVRLKTEKGSVVKIQSASKQKKVLNSKVKPIIEITNTKFDKRKSSVARKTQNDKDISCKENVCVKKSMRKANKCSENVSMDPSPISTIHKTNVARKRKRSPSCTPTRNVSIESGKKGQKSVDSTPKSTGRKRTLKKRRLTPVDDTQDSWSIYEKDCLQRALRTVNSGSTDFWNEVASIVQTKTSDECQLYHTKYLDEKTTNKINKSKGKTRHSSGRQKGDPVRGRRGTMKRKKEIRAFLDEQNEDYEDNLFDGTPFASRKPPSSLINQIDFDKEDDEIFGANCNIFTPLPGHSKFNSPQSCLRVPFASTKKTPACLGGFLDSPASAKRHCADKYIQTFVENKKKALPSVKTNPIPTNLTATTDLETSRLPKKSLFSPAGMASIFLDEDDDNDELHKDDNDDNRYMYYWNDLDCSQ